jgi:hypothetical protein
MGAQGRGDFLQFLVRFQVIAQFNPTDGGLKVMAVRWLERFHGQIIAKTGLGSKDDLQTVRDIASSIMTKP